MVRKWVILHKKKNGNGNLVMSHKTLHVLDYDYNNN